jgi:hypothetical protein
MNGALAKINVSKAGFQDYTFFRALVAVLLYSALKYSYFSVLSVPSYLFLLFLFFHFRERETLVAHIKKKY